MHRLICGVVLLVATATVGAGPARGEGWKAGVAKRTITPEGPIWMAGYAARNHPSEGVLHDLWAKALVLQDPDGKTAALVTLDLCGISRPLSTDIRDDLKGRYGLDRDRVVLACSHSHTSPVTRANLITMYGLDAEQARRINEYSDVLRKTIVSAVGEALDRLEPADLAWGTGRADFAVNRRNNKEGDVPKLRDRLALQGPTDHDVPVLRVAGPKDELRAVVFGYACHNTVLSFYQLSGDYAGFAQIALERAHPGAQAMFVAGCGGDQNPLPRRAVEQAEGYGRQLAAAVDRVLAGPMPAVSGPLRTAYTEIDLAFAELPTRAQLEEEAKAERIPVAGRAKHLLAQLESGGSLPKTYPYPVEVWRLGDGPTWVFLGGEAVVDYALRIKRNLGSSRTWVAAYCNDVMAYIPSLRVLKEGGYEGATSMVPYGLPSPWSEAVEEDVVGAVRDLVERTRQP